MRKASLVFLDKARCQKHMEQSVLPLDHLGVACTCLMIPLGDRKAEVRIPRGIQTGEKLRLKGKGMTGINSSVRGDMYLDITVETPVKLSSRQEELLREFEEERKKNGDSKNFFDKIKEWL